MATMMNSGALAERYVNEHPGTTLTRNAIKVMLRGGCVPSVRAGNRVFYSYEAFGQYLETGDAEPLAGSEYGTIGRIV